MIRFDDHSSRASRRSKDKLAAVRVIWDTWVKNLPKMYNPSENVAVDERLYPFKGRCQFRQYMPKKPEKYGIKFWVACCSKSGYAWNMQIYTGKPSSGTREKNQEMRVVLDMVKGLKGHNVTCDNFFTSLFTGRRTEKKEFDFGWYGKKSKPELPWELLHLQCRKLNSSRFAFSEDCTIVSYLPKKNRNVLVLSTMHNDNRVSDGKGNKPDIILHYNNTKGGVDNLDKMTSTYFCQRMTARWPLVIYCNIIDVSAYNAYVLWTEKHPAWNVGRLHKRRLFLEELGKAVVQPEMMRRKTPSRTAAAKSAVERLRKDAEQPFTSGITDTDASGKKRARCQLCVSSGNKTSKYAAVIQSYLDNGWAEEAPDAGPLGRTWYLPHHAVYQKGSSGEVKCRIVFEGSARFRDISLNDLLDAGSKLQADLLGILIRFRRYRIGLQADIQKMYLQVALYEADRDVCRFLWSEPGENELPKTYRLT
ncbi:PiggyBac transposable element-derived protein 4 [Trichinella nelsoni]|uniref:PiggyBac transposable element-derived protein 4 n=1 Tax=Trichinella nelsoni TaxID=6336 RepID=A0A0V0SHH7_9BILA|nr:PiggyBac transposable element-derived protein 4 [Trichinella nelsoni]